MGEGGLKYSFSVPASTDSVWAFLWDIDAVARCVPGCRDVFVKQDSVSYGAVVQRKAGPFLVGMELDIQVVQRTAPELLAVQITGSDRRLKSNVRVLIELRLNPEPSGPGTDATLVGIHATVHLSGLLATLSKHLIEMQVLQILHEFSDAFSGRFVSETH